MNETLGEGANRLKLFTERRSYITRCKDCGWNEYLPPYEFENDLCPRCHSELIQRRDTIHALFEGRPDRAPKTNLLEVGS